MHDGLGGGGYLAVVIIRPSLQNCVRVHKLLKSSTFGSPDSATLKLYEEKCSELFPLATVFKSSSPQLEATPSSSSIPEVKEVPKNISASGGGAMVLKQTALSSAAMSDLSGDINDLAKVSLKESVLNRKT